MSMPEEDASGSCSFCGKKVDLDKESTWREVTSWVSGPKLDGPVMREQTGRLACSDCIHKLRNGQAIDQEEFSFDDSELPGVSGETTSEVGG